VIASHDGVHHFLPGDQGVHDFARKNSTLGAVS
jgi:hypothetical protein